MSATGSVPPPAYTVIEKLAGQIQPLTGFAVSALLGENFMVYVACYVGQPEMTALEFVSQTGVIDA